MRRVILIVALSLALGACDGRTGKRSASAGGSASTQRADEQAADDGPIQPADPLRPEDPAVIDAALSHLAADPEFRPSPRDFERGRQLLVHRETTGGSAYLRPEQMRADAAAGMLPEDALADLEARNNGPPVTLSGMTFSSVRRAATPLDGLTTTSPDVVVIDFDRFQSEELFGFERQLKAAYPAAKAFARVALPGYSADGKRALVRIAFGPSAHGAMATYLLDKDDAGKWHVSWRGRCHYA